MLQENSTNFTPQMKEKGSISLQIANACYSLNPDNQNIQHHKSTFEIKTSMFFLRFMKSKQTTSKNRILISYRYSDQNTFIRWAKYFRITANGFSRFMFKRSTNLSRGLHTFLHKRQNSWDQFILMWRISMIGSFYDLQLMVW